MTDNAKAARREYYRRWRLEHPERVQAAQERYWAKKAAERRNREQAAADPAQQTRQIVEP